MIFKGVATPARIGLLLSTLLFAGCSDDNSAPFIEAVEQSLAQISSIEVSAQETILDLGTSRQFSVSAIDADGQPQDYTTKVHWNSTDSSVASVSSTGQVDAVAVGSANIEVSYGSLSDSLSVSVSDAELNTLTLTTSNESVNECQDIQIQASGNYADATQRNITEIVSWSSSNTAYGEFDTRSTYEGLLRTYDGGIALPVSANYRSLTSSIDITINDTLSSLLVLPDAPVLEEGATQAMTVTGTYSANNQGTSQADISENAQWTLVDTGSGTTIASIDNTYPDKGTFTANSVGSVYIQAACGGLSDQTLANIVTEDTLDQVVISGANEIEFTVGDDLSLTLTAEYTSSSDVDVTESATWSVETSNSTISVSNVDGSKGTVTATGAGTAIIKATYNGEVDFVSVVAISN